MIDVHTIARRIGRVMTKVRMHRTKYYLVSGTNIRGGLRQRRGSRSSFFFALSRTKIRRRRMQYTHLVFG